MQHPLMIFAIYLFDLLVLNMWFIVLLSKKYRQCLCDLIAHTATQAICRVTYHSKYPVRYLTDFIYHVGGYFSENSNIDDLAPEAYYLIKDFQSNCDLVHMICVSFYLMNTKYFLKSY